MAKQHTHPKLSRAIQQPVQADPPDPVRIPDFSLLDEETKDRLRLDAAAKIDAREIARAEQAFLEAEIERLDKERHPEVHEPEEDIDLNGLALYADRITINGKAYVFGRSYRVKKSLADVFREIMQRSRRHEAEIQSGDNYTTFYNKLRNGDWASKQFGVGKQISVASGARTGF
jgi:hypothetical protein